MADLARKARNTDIDMDESLDQVTLFAGVDVLAGQMIYPSNGLGGKFALADASVIASTRLVYMATHKARIGDPLTGIRNGVTDMHTLDALNYGAAVYLSDTAGELADAAGTVELQVGNVLPCFATGTGNAPSKLLKIDIPLNGTVAA